MTKTAYIASSWFNPEQTALMNAGVAALKQNTTVDMDNSYLPLAHQYKGLDTTEHPELLSDTEWQMATFNGDVQGINNTDLVIALYDPKLENSDPGVLWEIGYAYGIRKPVILVLPDGNEMPINLMPAIGVTAVINVADLTDYNFNFPNYVVYQGKAY
ncbi:nucleoside 2-deoxyribosyltransferase [Lacticaseibacillus thailandensis]|uniref:Purine trans deoxyribosylase (Nucleoside deoxyribosyltransferase-i) n=1 Tax=Lacticaseibacillus thailandensis DSM 22698 = JCM 13996 TaxID=1423810 RepID=A0A0R2C8N0_9LACO|nr:nucleoside 2-deoxyribosyltransferase [Lacticaseibacillus thailandensis]KRM87738.1 purine trans deoxyribosylase (nucleoside deoxyribosyltransferase-i) [Lacticaseibacillus thailandensis DSM 22698 = JCM 13996]